MLKAPKKPRGLHGAEREFADSSGGGVSNVYHWAGLMLSPPRLDNNIPIVCSGNTNKTFSLVLPTLIREERGNSDCYLLPPVSSFNFYLRVTRKCMYLFQARDGAVNMYPNNFLSWNHSKCIKNVLLLEVEGFLEEEGLVVQNIKHTGWGSTSQSVGIALTPWPVYSFPVSH